MRSKTKCSLRGSCVVKKGDRGLWFALWRVETVTPVLIIRQKVESTTLLNPSQAEFTGESYPPNWIDRNIQRISVQGASTAAGAR